jgi:hypothetical protein
MIRIVFVLITLALMILPFVLLRYSGIFKFNSKTGRFKISDRQLLELFVENGNVLSFKQLMNFCAMGSVELMIRLQSWLNNSTIRSLYSSDGETLYQLKFKMPGQKHRFEIKNYNNRKILEIVINHISGTEISPAYLVWLFDLKLQDARKVLKRMVSAGLVKTQLDKNFQRTFISNITLSNINETSIPLTTQKNEGKISLNDADLLKLAIQNKGWLTPSVVCIEKQISLDEAQEILDKLYEKGAFNLEVDEKDGTIEYWLRDTKLYKK